MPRDPLLHVVQQRAAIGAQAQAGQAAQGAQFGGRDLLGAQQVKARAGRAGEGGAFGQVLVAQGVDLAVQLHQVRHGFGVDDHQVAGDAAPGPQAQRLGQRAQHAHRLRRPGRHQHDGPVARDAEAPQQAPVAGLGHARGMCADLRAGEAHHQRSGERLDGGKVFSAERERAQADAGERGRHQRRALHVNRLVVLVDHCAQGGERVAGAGGEGELCLGVGRNAQPHGEGAHRVEAGVEGAALFGGVLGRFARQVVERSHWPRRALVAPPPALAVGLHADADHLRVGLGQEVRGLQPCFGGQARCALEQQRLLRGEPFGAHEEVGECGVSLVGARVGQGHLEGRDELDVKHAVAQVAQLDLAELDVVFRADPHGGVRLQLGPARVETHAVGVEHASVLRGRVGRRVLSDRHRLRPLVPAHVEEAAVCVAQRVVARTGDAGGAAAAPACTVGAQRDAVAPVRQHVRGLQCGGAGQHVAQQGRRALLQRQCGWPRWWRVQHRHLARRALVQQ